MSFYTPEAIQAEARYRQEKLRRSYQRPLWFQRKPKTQRPEPCAPELRARPAM
ncbi:hypothetical protein ACIA49_09295 [Kribbella sp. NPDC051587]|uniref:hypothetical protein n=1 Tax=unclassified Kribbella TaxID=2644121 RepID=UPI0036E76772